MKDTLYEDRRMSSAHYACVLWDWELEIYLASSFHTLLILCALLICSALRPCENCGARAGLELTEIPCAT